MQFEKTFKTGKDKHFRVLEKNVKRVYFVTSLKKKEVSRDI